MIFGQAFETSTFSQLYSLPKRLANNTMEEEICGFSIFLILQSSPTSQLLAHHNLFNASKLARAN